MTIITYPLSEEEQKLLKKIFKFRLFIGVFFMLPLVYAVFFIFFNVSNKFLNSEYDGMSFFALLFAIIIVLLFFKYVIPFYKRSYKNLAEKNKLIITTRILNVEKRTTTKGIRYIITTEYRKIDNWAISIIDNQPPFIFSDVSVGSSLEIHCLEHNKTDIFKITKSS